MPVLRWYSALEDPAARGRMRPDLTIDGDGVHSQRFADADPHGCIFEYVYLARPDTSIAGRSIQAGRLDGLVMLP